MDRTLYMLCRLCYPSLKIMKSGRPLRVILLQLDPHLRRRLFSQERKDIDMNAKQMVDLSMEQDAEESLKTLETLRDFLSENPDEEASVQLARGLRSLCGRAPGVQAKQMAYAGLEGIAAEYGENQEIREELAKGLALLIANLDEINGMVYKARLQGLMWGYPELEKVIQNLED